MWGHIRRMHARPHRRKDQLSLRAPTTSKMGTEMAPTGRGALEGHIRGTFYTLNQFQVGRFHDASHMSIQVLELFGRSEYHDSALSN